MSKRYVIRAVDASRCREADKVEKYDAVFFTEQHSDAVQLTEAVLSRGASAILLNEKSCSPRSLEMIAARCRDSGAMLAEVETFSSLLDLRDFFLHEIFRDRKRRRRLTIELQRVLLNLAPLERCRTVFDRYGYFTGMDYCVADFYMGSDDEGNPPDIETLTRMERCLEIGARETIDGTQAFSLGGDIVLLMEGQCEKVLAAAGSALAAIPNELRERFSVGAGIGRQGFGVEGVRRSFLTARRTANILAARGSGGVLSYEMLGISKMLMELDREDEGVKEFLCETLQPLLDSDAHTGGNLTEFLRVYIELGGSVKKVSEAMYVHRNTVNNRLAQISRVLRRDISDLQVLADVAVALKLHEMFLGDDMR